MLDSSFRDMWINQAQDFDFWGEKTTGLQETALIYGV